MKEFVVPKLDQLNSQPEVQRLLTGLLSHPGVQTFLWAGPEGTGKKTYAMALTRSLFCLEGPNCTGCASCRQVLSRTHPDFFWLERPEGKTEIIVDSIKELDKKISNAPLLAKVKVAVIADADLMNDDAQNVFLKSLEEPPAKTIIILLAEKKGDFLPTVLSRCRLIRFPALPTQIVESILVNTYGWDQEQAKKAALETEGNLSMALKMGDENWTQFQDKICIDFDRCLQGQDEEWLTLVSEYDQWEPEFLGEEEMTATRRKNKVLTAALRVYSTLWSRRLYGLLETPMPLNSLPADLVLSCLQKHMDMFSTNVPSKMIMDHLFLELREGFQKGQLMNRSFKDLAIEI